MMSIQHTDNISFTICNVGSHNHYLRSYIVTRIRKAILATLLVLALAFQFVSTLASEPVSASSSTGVSVSANSGDGEQLEENCGTIHFRGF